MARFLKFFHLEGSIDVEVNGVGGYKIVRFVVDHMTNRKLQDDFPTEHLTDFLESFHPNNKAVSPRNFLHESSLSKSDLLTIPKEKRAILHFIKRKFAEKPGDKRKF